VGQPVPSFKPTTYILVKLNPFAILQAPSFLFSTNAMKSLSLSFTHQVCRQEALLALPSMLPLLPHAPISPLALALLQLPIHVLLLTVERRLPLQFATRVLLACVFLRWLPECFVWGATWVVKIERNTLIVATDYTPSMIVDQNTMFFSNVYTCRHLLSKKILVDICFTITLKSPRICKVVKINYEFMFRWINIVCDLISFLW
jgi:hypothetical protein